MATRIRRPGAAAVLPVSAARPEEPAPPRWETTGGQGRKRSSGRRGKSACLILGRGLKKGREGAQPLREEGKNVGKSARPLRGKSLKSGGKEGPSLRRRGIKRGEEGEKRTSARVRVFLVGNLFSVLFPALLYGALFLICRLMVRPHSAWYSRLIKPFFCLPDWGFGVLWGILLLLQFLSMAFAARAGCGFRLTLEYLIHAVFILFFVLFFFTFKSVFAPFLVNLLMAMQSFVLVRKLGRISGPAAGLQIGCLAGILYCLTVIYSVLLLN